MNKDSDSNYDFVEKVDFLNGHISDAKSVCFDRVEESPYHPDSNILVEYNILNWDKLTKTVLEIFKIFFNIDMMGFDIGITNNGFKIMEINLHPGIKFMQVFESLYKDERNKKFFENKLNKGK